MFSITDIQLNGLATHFIGNKANGESLEISKELVDIDSIELRNILLQYFLAPFQNVESYNFWHSSDLQLHELMHYASKIFNDNSELQLQSVNIAKHLYEATNLPNIKNGELHVAFFAGCPIDGRLVNAIGIYKTETKESFLKMKQTNLGYQFQSDEGISLNKLDKGCLIFNVDEEIGYRIHIVDKTNKSGGAQFWKDTFLKVRAASDNYHQTNDYLQLCKEFIVEKVPTVYEVNKVEQIDLLNKSVNYFKKNEQFNKEDFQQEVFGSEELIRSFDAYETEFKSNYEVDFQDEFEISNNAVKKQARGMRNILKLDKNFHIYVHGDSSLIEKGYDEESGMSYYKLYFNDES